MEDVDIREAYYRQGGLNYRHGPQRLLQRPHQGAKVIIGPPENPSTNQGGQRTDKVQVLQGEDHLAHWVPKERINIGVRLYI